MDISLLTRVSNEIYWETQKRVLFPIHYSMEILSNTLKCQGLLYALTSKMTTPGGPPSLRFSIKAWIVLELGVFRTHIIALAHLPVFHFGEAD